MNRLGTIPAISIDITTHFGYQNRGRHSQFATQVGVPAHYRELVVRTKTAQLQKTN